MNKDRRKVLDEIRERMESLKDDLDSIRSDLGINASNEAFLERHPEWARELYPLYQYNHLEYEVVGHEDE